MTPIDIYYIEMTPASKVLCPLDFGALAVLPHGQIAGFYGVFRTFGGCIRNTKRSVYHKNWLSASFFQVLYQSGIDVF